MKNTLLLKVLPVILSLGTGFAQTAAERLEQGVQLQTADGDLTAAIAEYKAVIKSAAQGNRLAAEARYRLAECFMLQGNFERMNDHLEALNGDFPADNKWVVKGSKLAPRKTRFSGTPWNDGKLYVYEVKVNNGNVIGNFMSGVLPEKAGGKEAWDAITVRSAGGASLSRSRFLTEGYRAIESRWYIGSIGDVKVSYGPKGNPIVTDSQSGESREMYDAKVLASNTAPLIENEQMVQMIRALNQELGTKQKTMILAAHNPGLPINFDLEVTAHEEVTVPAGTFQCAKIETSIKQTFYVSRGENRELVRMDMGPAKIDLISSEDWDGKKPSKIRAKDQGAGFTLPGMVLYSPPVEKEEIFRMQIWCGDFAGRDGLIEINKVENLVEGARGSSSDYANTLHEGFAKNFDSFEVLGNEWDKFQINGVDAVGMSIKRQSGDIVTFEYQVHALGESHALSFRLNYAQPDQEKAIARAREIVDSFRW